MAIQTFGNYACRRHPHVHAPLAALFRAKVLGMLKKEGRIDDALIANLLTWRECIKKVWEIDPLACPKCGGEMKIISLLRGTLHGVVFIAPFFCQGRRKGFFITLITIT